MQYSCSQSWDGDPSLDPFMIRVVPEEQFVSDALFETPTAAKFSKHFLDLIVWADTADANYINNLKSLELNSVPVWNHPTSQVPTLLFNHMPGNQNLHWVRIELGTTGKSLRLISNSKVRFGGQLYGYGAADAYGWPAASAYRTTSSIDTMPPVLVVDNVCGDYNVVANELRNIPNPPTTPPLRTDQVESGISQIFFDPAQPDSNFRLVLVTDTILRSVPTYKTFRFRVEIIDKTKDAFARVLVLDDGYNTTTGSPNQAAFVARYTAPKLSGLSGHISFGKHRVGVGSSRTLSFTNMSPDDITISSLRLRLGVHFTITLGAITSQLQLQPNASHSLTIAYDALHDSASTPVGIDFDTLIIGVGCGEIRSVVTGFAVQPRIAVMDLPFGDVAPGVNTCKPLTITNPGSDTLVVTGLTGYETSDFSLSSPLLTPLPITVRPGQSVNLRNVCFEQSVSSVAEVAVTFSSNAVLGDSVSVWTANTLIDVKELLEVLRFEVSPQPAIDMFNVLFAEQTGPGSTLQVVDTRGAVVLTWRLAEGLTSFRASISAIATGSYILWVTSNQTSFATPFVITR